MIRLVRGLKPWLLGWITALAALPATADDRWAHLSYEPTGLDWSAAEVERATAGNFDAIIERAKRAGQLGCQLSCDRVSRIFDRLVALARVQTERSRRLPWSLTVLRSPGVEAMAMPGGQVLISEPFILSRQFDDETLAFVLAHEMAHCILEHERQTLQFARMLLPHDVPRSVADVYVEIDYNFALLKSLEPAMQQGELEADELGLLLASAAGFAPQRQLAFVEQEAAHERDSEPLVRTHPPARVRLDKLRLRLPLAERIYAVARAADR
jgi:predicted Zn-dependent protease